MEKFEHTDDIVADMLGCSTFVSEREPDPTSFDKLVQKYMPYHHPHHKK
jgi:hypothetical protein